MLQPDQDITRFDHQSFKKKFIDLDHDDDAENANDLRGGADRLIVLIESSIPNFDVDNLGTFAPANNHNGVLLPIVQDPLHNHLVTSHVQRNQVTKKTSLIFTSISCWPPRGLEKRTGFLLFMRLQNLFTRALSPFCAPVGWTVLLMPLMQHQNF